MFVILQQGSKACADLQDKCKDHMGSRLSVVSYVCLYQGILLVVRGMLPTYIWLWSALVDATVGAWVVCLAVHGKLPSSLGW
jgi:hypothetical protein